MIRLKTYEKFPPGGFPYVQSEGIHRVFPSCGGFMEQVRKVSAFRTHNNLPRPGLEDTAVDIDAFTCARLNNNPDFCYDTDQNFAAVMQNIAPSAGGCGGCGIPIS